MRIVEKVLHHYPGSIRALARESGVDHSVLIKVRDGELGLSDDAAQRLVKALRRQGKLSRRNADTLDRLADELERGKER